MGGGAVTAENARFVTMAWPVALHIVSATVFCVLGAFQFDSAWRLRHPGLHRGAGRVAAPSAILAALTGLWMTALSPIPAELQGPLLSLVRGVVGLAMLLSISMAVRAVQQGRIAHHTAWMVRAYALAQGAGTQVLILLPVTLMAGAPTFAVRDVLMASAWGLNLIVAEWIVRCRLPPARPRRGA
jgi:uncharacterized membrane protein